MKLSDIYTLGSTPERYNQTPDYGELNFGHAGARSNQGQDIVRYPDTYTCGCGCNNSWAKQCEGQTTHCTSDCVKTFDISGQINIAESCSGGCCEKKVKASDGCGSNDHEKVERVGDSCYCDECGNYQGYCGEVPCVTSKSGQG